MERSQPNLAVMAMVFFIGVGTLIRFSQHLFQVSQNVRLVDVVGLSGGGAACGAALFGFIFALRGRKERT
jgi:membrane-associated PAP2 superfamily phosphatase